MAISTPKTMINKILSALICIITTTSASDTLVIIGTGEKGIYSSILNQKNGTLSDPVFAAKMPATGFLAKHPSKPILYSTGEITRKKGCVVAYKIQDNGKFKEFSRQSTMGERLAHISLDSTTKILMGANYRGGSVVSFPIKTDGSIGKLVSIHKHEGSSVNPQRQAKPHAHSIYSGPNNKFAYAPDLGIDKVMIYSINPATAILTLAGQAATPAGSGPRHMKFGKDGKLAYVLNELDLTISVFTHDASTGKLNHKQIISTLPIDKTRQRMSCSEIRVSKDGKYIYNANRDLDEKGRDSISVFKVSETGQLARVQTIAAEVWIPRNINIDPSGKWLLVAGQRSNEVPVFKIDQLTGKLSSTGHKISIPKPMCIEFAPQAIK
ncbi:MAG: lactonase family protein [Akkermansiaceae bacterium]|jgi:6-phosphogluconolactonase|nr:lactonase family protein [Akkermansiaceae bacterium]